MLTIPRCAVLLYVLHVPAFAQADAVLAPPDGLRFDKHEAVQAALKSPRPLFGHSESAPVRAWKEHLLARADGETFNCALSFAIGGEIKRDAYIGARAFGQTRTLKPGAPQGQR